jgi:alkylhydroperoxidase/carboxymuconolactone decarboxylase family protein YurZ
MGIAQRAHVCGDGVPDDTSSIGMDVRRQALGDAYVDADLAGPDEFLMACQTQLTEQVWGRGLTGTALDRKTKCILTLGILAALGRSRRSGST